MQRVSLLLLILLFSITPVAFAVLPGTTSEPLLEDAAARAGALYAEALDLHERKRLDGAEDLYRRAAVLGRDLPEDHVTRLDIQLGLARLLLDRGEAAAAEPLLRIASARLSARGMPDWRAAEAASLLGACLAARGAEAEAEGLLARGFTELERSFGATDPRVRRALSRLAEYYRAGDEATEEEEDVILVKIFEEEDRLGGGRKKDVPRPR